MPDHCPYCFTSLKMPNMLSLLICPNPRCPGRQQPTFRPTFMDGAPVPQHYAGAVTKMIEEACEAEDRIGIVELDL